jgi:hypothetical protein
METRMIRFISRFMTQARADRLMYGCDVAVLIGVFVFLAFQVVN